MCCLLVHWLDWTPTEMSRLQECFLRRPWTTNTSSTRRTRATPRSRYNDLRLLHKHDDERFADFLPKMLAPAIARIFVGTTGLSCATA